MGKSVNGVIFLDVDGTIVKHNSCPLEQSDDILDGTISKIADFIENRYQIVFTTARSKKECRVLREYFSDHYGRKFKWLYNMGTGKRIVINDVKDNVAKAGHINVVRNMGIGNVVLPRA